MTVEKTTRVLNRLDDSNILLVFLFWKRVFIYSRENKPLYLVV